MDNSLINAIDTGTLRVDVTSPEGRPMENVSVEISYSGDPDNTIETLFTDSIGRTEPVTLPAPPLEFSETPSVEQPYSDYNIVIRAPEYPPISINGINLFPTRLSIQPVRFPFPPMDPMGRIITIGPNTLFGDYPPKIPESEIKPIRNTGEIVLDRVVVPEFVVVHNGVPSDSSAANYTVRFADYIKNVVSSEIYPTWPEETIRANVIAIVSFTLNRVFTEWYRNKGYDFTITSSTAYDQKWIYGRNIFDNISAIVDDVFANYVSRPNIKQPILTQYCDGKRTTCDGLSQWGSKYLGDDNYTALEILRTYFGEEIYINTAEEVSGIPMSWPGYVLEIGSYGPPVSVIQEQLDFIRSVYTNIPPVVVDGIYGEETEAAVKKFQQVFDLPQSGTVNFPTWYRISKMYVALAGLAEPN